MNNLLIKYYNLKNCELRIYDDGYLFFVDGIRYFLVKTNYSEETIKDLCAMSEVLCKKGAMVHSFIKNIDNKYISDGYVLMRINMFGEKISLYDINLFNKIINDNKVYIDMNSFWYDKLDYLDKQRNFLSTNSLINNSFDYYLGISELLLKNLKKNIGDTRITLSHRSLKSLNIIDFYNPFNITYDVWLKDLSYYIKKTNNYELLDKYINRLNKYELNYLFTRLCFPFEYFDEMSQIIIDMKNEKGIMRIINNIDKYESHLFNMEKIFGINVFKWIKK